MKVQLATAGKIDVFVCIRLLVLVLLTSPTLVRAQFIVSTNADRTLTINRYTGSDADLAIPSTIDGMSVSAIGSFAIPGTVTNVTIPNTVTSIKSVAFCSCTNLSTITIPGSVTNFGEEVFADCRILARVYFTGNAPSVGSSLGSPSVVYYLPGTTGWGKNFAGCPTVLWLPPNYSDFVIATNVDNTVTIDGYYGSDRELAIPSTIDGKSVTSIGTYAFNGCSSLTRVTIPESITNIGDSAFQTCINLTNVTIPKSVSNIGVSAFESCVRLTEIIIPDSVTNLASRAFYGCASLTQVEIPKSASKIGSLAFTACDSLLTIKVDPANPTYASVDGFLLNKSQNALLQCPNGKGGDLSIPSSVDTIGDLAFGYCKKLTRFVIPDRVVSVGANAFYVCTGLTNIVISSNITTIPGGMFYFCTSLADIEIPDGITNIGASAFSVCTKLGTVKIPNHVRSIGSYAFESCSSLTNISISTNVTAIGFRVFGRCSNLRSITLPQSVVSIGMGAFADCGLTNLIIPNSVTTIEPLAFEYCTNLANVTIPNSVTSIGTGAFTSCGLTNVTIPKSVLTLSVLVFRNCKLLSIDVDPANPNFSSVDGILLNKKKTALLTYPSGRSGAVTIPPGITSIEAYAFLYCNDIESITIPATVTNIGAGVLCSRLTAAYFMGNAPTADNNTFQNIPVTVYYKPGTTGWGSTFAGRPSACWNPLLRLTGGLTAQMLDITGTADIPIVLEACTNLSNPVWLPQLTGTLTNGSITLADPADCEARFYRIRTP